MLENWDLNSDVSESSILISEKWFEFAEVIACRGHSQAVAIELEDGPEKRIKINIKIM